MPPFGSPTIKCRYELMYNLIYIDWIPASLEIPQALNDLNLWAKVQNNISWLLPASYPSVIDNSLVHVGLGLEQLEPLPPVP